MAGRKWGFVLWIVVYSIYVGSNLFQATPEGDALQIIKEMLHAEVNWIGNDPCVGWEGVSCSLNHVVSLNLSGKSLHGRLPAEIGQLSFLNSLDLSNNHIEENIPDEMANLTDLHSLSFRYNLLSGGFPQAILKLRKIVFLRLDNTRLSGPLPSNIQQLSSLEYLYLGNCSFTGRIPTEFGNLANLKGLSIWGNNINSTLPVELSKLTNLEILYVDPQYFLRRHLAPSSDVYSYGVVLLELITGQKAIDQSRVEEFNLVEWVKLKFREADVETIIDPPLLHDSLLQDFSTTIELALKCTAFERSRRPSMKVSFFLGCRTNTGTFTEEVGCSERKRTTH